MKYPKKFETIEGYVQRLKVPGGWLVRTVCYESGVHMLFISDPNHEWELEDEK